MQHEYAIRRRPSLSLPILRKSRSQHRAGTLTLGNLLLDLGGTSFGWAIVLFSLVTLLPLPPGSTLVTALPLLLTTGQMMLGYPHARIPGRLSQLRLDPQRLRRTLLGLRPVTRRLERVLTQRHTWIFAPRNERLLGLVLFLVALALFLPVPFSGWFPAISLFISGIGLVERDGLVTGLGVACGAISVLFTGLVLISLAAGAEALIH
ncbi:exopolysaccharide biosynthesis protein [Marinibacterium profundimaris]|uniref:Exopolysaccharide biosynthesis protein exod n=1 Tax=Marinibacterium profundimaris TaxID=1679460 RepID=A0A225NF52_9RHOB|nr:exopolysaccharide biosynthesis protein [Marinibacterium profundimaris]OWU71041.1 exopolysaccharide biosynthesis protein exod [Marinibacterium profundimaris]